MARGPGRADPRPSRERLSRLGPALAQVTRWLTRFGDAVAWVGRWLLAILMISLLGIITLQVVDRHVIDVPIAAPDAYARIVLLWLAFIGFALASRAGLAIRVDLMDHWLPARVHIWLSVGFDLMKLAVLVLLVVKGWLLVEIGFDQSILGTDLTTAVPNAGLWVGCLMLFAFVVIALLQAATGTGPAREGFETDRRAE